MSMTKDEIVAELRRLQVSDYHLARLATENTGRDKDGAYFRGKADAFEYAAELIRQEMREPEGNVTPMHPTSVVVDTRDGYTYYRDANGRLFDLDAARRFADIRNETEWDRYQVFALAKMPLRDPNEQRCDR
jgi:hypothetical protein